MKDLVIVGCGNTGEHVYTFVSKYKLFNILGFAVDEQYITHGSFLEKPVYPLEKLDEYVDKKNTLLYVALLWNRLNGDRRDLYERLKREGWQFANLIAPTAIIDGQIGENCWIHDYSSVWFGTTIGNNVIIRPYVLVSEKCVIGDHVYLAPHVTIAGKCSVGEQTFIGLNATVFDTRQVGKKCIIGACTAIRRDVSDYSVVKVASNTNDLEQYSAKEIEGKLVHTKNVR